MDQDENANTTTKTNYMLLVECEAPSLWWWAGVPPGLLVPTATMKSVRRIVGIPCVLAIRQ